ncbi:MAG: hypothetical protein B6I24_11750 [Bacteroidetes bacterium 4572_128]|nr:MAG: hypothetical protein B6I24_11750 [Bacteroidetes bacterium 4572_128]
MKKYEKIKFKILPPGTIAFVIIIFFFITEILDLQEKNFSQNKSENTDFIKKTFNNLISYEAEILKSNILFLAEDKKLQNFFSQKDKENLIKYGKSIYKKLNSEFQITHFYFIDTNDICFLRMHNTKRFGDKIKRFTYKKAKENKKIFYGIELGPYGTFALRLVMPWIVNNKIIGYLELGKEIDNLTKTLKNISKFDFVFIINKKFIKTRKKWEEGLKILNNKNNFQWDDFKNFVVIDNTLKNFKAIKKLIDIENSKNENFFDINQKKKLYKTTDLLDTRNQNVGKIIIIYDITEQKNYIKNLIYKQILIGSSILLILFFLFYFYFNKIEKFISLNKKEILSEIEKRKKTEILIKEKTRSLELILNGIPDKIYITDKSYKIKFANSAMRKKYGKDIFGKKCYKVNYNLEKACSWCVLKELKNRKFINYETKKDNKYFIVRNIMFNDFEKLTIFNDITEIKEKEFKLKETNEEYLTINEEYKSQNEVLLLSKEKIESNAKLLLKIMENYPNSFISIIDKNLKLNFTSGQEFKNIKRDADYFLNLNLNEIFLKNFSFIKEKFLKTFYGKETEFIFRTKNNLFYLKILSKNNELNLKNKNIISSINYAKSIQNAMLPDKYCLKQFLSENFIGDFYWVKQFNDKILIALGDCTGHGVPGAFMSILGITFLNEIISNFRLDSKIKANEVLNKLRIKIKKALSQGEGIRKNNNGMDIAFCVLNLTNRKFQYSGANIPLILMRKNNNEKYEMQDFEANKMPIGNYRKEKDFTNNVIQLYNNDLIYMFSDGFQDQFGGEKGRKFLRKNLKNLLLENCNKDFLEQKRIIENTFYKWKKNNKQIDDVSVMGFKIFESYRNVEFF